MVPSDGDSVINTTKKKIEMAMQMRQNVSDFVLSIHVAVSVSACCCSSSDISQAVFILGQSLRASTEVVGIPHPVVCLECQERQTSSEEAQRLLCVAERLFVYFSEDLQQNLL